MRICRFTHPSFAAPRYGLLEGLRLLPLVSEEPFSSSSESSAESSPELSEAPRTESPVALAEARLVAPVTPSKIVCVGRNYLEHALELGNKLPEQPLLFLKAPSALIGPEEAIRLPPESQEVEHEGELGVVIGRKARRLSESEDPLSYVFGYTCVNDVTARDLQRRDVQFTRAKSFDTFCPVGPFIETMLDPLDLLVTTHLNGEVRQQARTSAMAFNVPFLVRYISHAMTLLPGDLIATGTPAGVSRMKDGDVVEVEVQGIGTLRNQVRDSGPVS